MNYHLLKVIVCPICKNNLCYSKDERELICMVDNLAFPFSNGIPVLLENKARILTNEEKNRREI